MYTRRLTCLPVACLLFALVGCSNYTVTFELGDVINAAGDDLRREQLEVDIVCLDGENAKRYPELVNGSVRAKEWFQSRDQNEAKFNNIARDQIYALRHAADKRDTLMGGPLVSARDLPAGAKPQVNVEVKHPDTWGGSILIFGRFTDGRNVLPVEPLQIKPLPAWENQIRVSVGRKNMEWIRR